MTKTIYLHPFNFHFGPFKKNTIPQKDVTMLRSNVPIYLSLNDQGLMSNDHSL